MGGAPSKCKLSVIIFISDQFIIQEAFTQVNNSSQKRNVWPVGLKNSLSKWVHGDHRRRIYTDEKTKVVAVSWVIKLLQFLSELAILHKDELKNRLICTLFFNSSWCESAYYSNRPGTK